MAPHCHVAGEKEGQVHLSGELPSQTRGIEKVKCQDLRHLWKDLECLNSSFFD